MALQISSFPEVFLLCHFQFQPNYDATHRQVNDTKWVILGNKCLSQKYLQCACVLSVVGA